MHRFTALLLLFALFTTAAHAQRRIKGSGNLITEQRDVRGFDEVSTSHAIKVDIRQGNSFKVTVEADDNVMNLVETEVRGSQLRIGLPNGNYSMNNTTIHVSVVMPSLTDVRLSGASNAMVSDFDQPGGDLELDLSGASRIEFKNCTVDEVDITASGASSIRARDLSAKEADINANGASSVKISVSDRLKGKASGASSVRYTGSPTVDVNSSGASSIRGGR